MISGAPIVRPQQLVRSVTQDMNWAILKNASVAVTKDLQRLLVALVGYAVHIFLNVKVVIQIMMMDIRQYYVIIVVLGIF
jgi:hypothetical protein